LFLKGPCEEREERRLSIADDSATLEVNSPPPTHAQIPAARRSALAALWTEAFEHPL